MTLLVSGFLWITFGMLFVLLLYAFMVGGAGLQVLGFFFPVAPLTIVVGVVHFIGFSGAAVICFIIGLGLISRLVSVEQTNR